MKNSKYIAGGLTFILFQIVLSLDFYTSIGLSIFVFSATKFIVGLGSKIEIKDIIVLTALLQWVIGPFLAYNYYPYDEFYYMSVEQDVYMSFVVPALIALMIGLYFPFKNEQSNDNIYLLRVTDLIKKYKNLDLLLVFGGAIINIFILSFPQSIRFAASLLSDVRFVGLYLLLLSNRKNKWLIIGGVLFMLMLTALRYAMFHDLLLWLSFFLVIAAFVYKPTIRKKVIFAFAFIVLTVTIQTVKHSFREALHEGSGEGLELFANLVQEEVGGDYVTSESNLSAMVTRINQGWIIARIMHWTPSREPFANGETIYDALKTAFMPRFLFPNKIKAGGRTYFTRFTGKDIREDTSMGLSLLGEAYANYGIYGGFFFMFLIGLFYNLFIKKIYRIAIKHPAIIFFIPLIFQQVVKAETDFSVIINHLFKASVAVWLIFWGLKTFFKIRL